MKDIIEEIFGNGDIPELVNDISELMVGVASGMVVLFLLIRLGWTYVSALRTNTTLDLGKIKISILLGLCIVMLLQLYTPVIGLVDNIMMSLVRSIQENVEYDNYHAYLKQIGDQQDALSTGMSVGDEENTEGNFFSEVGSIFNAFTLDNAYNFLVSLVMAILKLVIEVIGSVLVIVAYMNISFFKIIGPLSIVFSIVPFLQGHLGKWFGALLGGYSTLAAIAILEGFFNVVAGVLIDVEVPSTSFLIIIQLVIVGMYLSAGKLGGYIVGTDTVSDALSSIQSNARAIGQSAMTGGTAAATTAAASKAAAVKTGTGISKSIIDALPKPK